VAISPDGSAFVIWSNGVVKVITVGSFSVKWQGRVGAIDQFWGLTLSRGGKFLGITKRDHVLFS
jgi:hypothetical protein